VPLKGVQAYSLFYLSMEQQSDNIRLIGYLSEFVTRDRLKTFDKVLDHRTRYISVVLEDLYQPHNASAVLRTCDCFGIQDVHIIENRNTYSISADVALGSNKWLTLKKYNRTEFNTPDTYRTLRSAGYRIVATTPHRDDTTLNDFDLKKGKLVLVFGTELEGLSETAIKEADEYLRIPMVGFTESFNISVAAAIILWQLTSRLKRSTIRWQLLPHERTELKLAWLKRSIKKSDLLIREFLENERNKNR
jgi:tRNA (guanosine-2'-O-)-methyltransferase